MENQKKTVFDHLATLYRRKWLLMAPAALGLSIGYAVTAKMPDYYSSATLISAEEQQLPEQYVTPTDRTPFSQRLNTISQQIMSRAKLHGIIKQYRLYQDERDGVLERIKRLFSIAPADISPDDAIIDRMKQDIEFKAVDEPRKGTTGNTFTITYSGRDPRLAMQVTNRLASLFIEENNRVMEQYAEGTSEFLGGELEKAKRELDVFEKALKDFKEANMGALPEQLDANLRTLDRLQLDLQTASGALKNAEDRRVLLEGQLSINSNGQLTAPNPLVIELEKLRNELRALLSMYRENYPDVVITKKQIKDIEEQLSRKGDRKNTGEAELRNPAVYAELMATKSQISTLKQREADIKRQIKEYQTRVENTPTNEQRQSNLFRDYKISLQDYQTLLEKKLNARLAQNLEKRQRSGRFRIIDPANLPLGPDRPNKPRIWLIGAMGGGGLGAALVFLVEFLNPAFRKPEDFEGVLPSPVLASIPVIQLKPGRPANKLTVVKGRK